MMASLFGVFLGACLFSALLWSVYRAVVTKGLQRVNGVVVTLATLLGMLGLSNGWPLALMIGGPALILFGLAQIFTDPGWSKLLPAVQFLFGIIVILVLMRVPG